MGLACGNSLIGCRRRKFATMSIVARGFAFGLLLHTKLLQSFRSTKARISIALPNQLLGVLLVEFKPFGLTIGAMTPSFVRTFVVINPRPSQRANQVCFRPGNKPILVSVLQPENELPSVPTGVELREEGRTQPSNMEITGGTGSKTEADGHGLGVEAVGGGWT